MQFLKFSYHIINKQKVGVKNKIKILIKDYSTRMCNSEVDKLIVRCPYDDIEIPKKTFTEIIWQQHIKWKNKKAVVCGLTGEEFTFSELREHSMLIGKCLINEGLCSGDVLALLMPNCPQYISIILGASERGITLCSINPLYTADEITHQIKNSGAKKIITIPEKVLDVTKAVDKLKAEKSLPPNFKIFCIKGFHKNNMTSIKNTICLSDLVNRLKIANNTQNIQVSSNENSLAIISHSSGTTGLPKGVCLTHKNVTSSILQMAQPNMTVFKETTEDHQDVLPMVLPIFHNFGLEMILCALYHGSKIVTLPKFEENIFLSVLKQHKATMLFVVPPMVLFLGSNPLVTEDHLRHVRCMFTAAAPVGEDDIIRCLKKAPKDINVVQGYGQTEAMCCLTHTPYGSKNYKSLGIPLVNTQIKIVDLQTGKSKRPGEEGEICFKGPQMSLGYLNNPKATSEAIDEDGWFHTGDIGYYDEDAYFYLVERMKELIKVKGFQVAPAELEHILRSFPGIDEAAVIGVPDPRKGEVPIGFIKKAKGLTVAENDIREYLAGKVASFKLIDKYIFVDSIPTSPSGKILRKELKSMYLSTHSKG